MESSRTVVIAQRLLKARLARAGLFGPDIAAMFGEAAYDILLDLYVANAQGRPVSVTSACIASGVPETSALRVLSRLVDAGAVERQADHEDGRRSLLSLPRHTISAIEQHLLTICPPER